MAKPFMLSLSFCLLVLASGVLARVDRFNECQLDNINALEPDNRIESEGGVTETWNSSRPELRCAGVTVVRRTIEPKGLHLPSYTNSPQLTFIVQGKGAVGISIPGCADTFEEARTQSREGRRRGGLPQLLDRHQKIRHFKVGDMIAIPAGIPYWSYNYGDEPLVAITLLDTTNSENQLDASPRRFYLAGNPEKEHPETTQEQEQREPRRERPGGRRHGQHEEEEQEEGNRSILSGFAPEFISQSFNVDEEIARRIQSPREGNDQIIRLKDGLSVISPEWEEEEAEEEEEEEEGWEPRSRRGHGGRGGDEEEEEEEEWSPEHRRPHGGQRGRRGPRGQPGEREQGSRGRGRGQQGQEEGEEEEEEEEDKRRPWRRGSEQRRRRGPGRQEEEEEEDERRPWRRGSEHRRPGRRGPGQQQEEEEEEEEDERQPWRRGSEHRRPGRRGPGQQEEEEEEEDERRPWRRGSEQRRQGKRGPGQQQEEEEEEKEDERRPWRRGSEQRRQGSRGHGQQEEEEEGEQQWSQKRQHREHGSRGRGQHEEQEEEEEEGRPWGKGRRRHWSRRETRRWEPEGEEEEEEWGECNSKVCNRRTLHSHLIQKTHNGLEETLCTAKLHENIARPARADLYNPRAGRISSVNSLSLPILRWFKLSAEHVLLYRNGIYAPHWNINANSVIYVTRGHGRVQIVNCEGKAVFDDVLRRGQLLVVPQNFAVAKQAGEEGFEYVAFKTNDQAATSPLKQVIRGIPAEVLQNAFGLRQHQVTALKYNGNQGPLVYADSQIRSEDHVLAKV